MSSPTADGTGTTPESRPPLPQGTLPPDEQWFQYFKTRRPEPADVQKLVNSLHRAGQHEHVIAVIEAALANSQSQSWMYDVLALSMEIAERPQEDINRVLLSRVDFTTTDVPNLLYSAAFLVRLGGKKQALHLYRQASQINATRPEPYILGLKLSRELKDIAAIEWAATGIMMHAWTQDRAKRQLDAQDAIADTARELRESRRKDEADRLEQSLATASQRDLILRLDWSGDGELNLEVEEPFGTVCSTLNPLSAGGGVIVHNGYGPKPENCYDEYVCVKGGSGDYRARIHHVAGNIVGKRCQLTVVRYGGTDKELVRKVSIPLDKPTKVVRLSLHEGRREAIGPEPTREATPSSSRRASRQQIIASIRRAIGGMAANQGGAAGGGPGGRGGGGLPAGNFSAGVGFTPVIGLIREGVSLSATAVVSADRRYVRLALAPFFNTLRSIETFSFVGGGGGGQGQGGGQGGGGQGQGGGGQGGAGQGGGGP